MSDPSGGSTFIGRRAQLEKLGSSLQRSQLVTVTGAPGVGKTRLAREYARASGIGSVYVCGLAEATTFEGVLARIGSVVGGASEAPRLDRAQQSLEYALRACGAALIILDNFEQLVRVASELVRDLVAVAPDDVRFIVTSRERLAIEGELIFELPPLSVPSSARVCESEAVELFIARARVSRPAFAPSGAELESLGELVRLLDGLPLAIELAAASVAVLTPAELIARIGQRFGGLTQSPAERRPATLWRTIGASWALLTPREQLALAQLSVFRGDFAIDAAEAVLEPGAPPVLDVLQSLCDKSLLAVAEADVAAPRFLLLTSIREFAETQLEAANGAQERHAQYFIQRGFAWCEQLDRRDDPELREQLRVEHENLLAVHERFLLLRGELHSAALSAAIILARTASSFANATTLHALDSALDAAGAGIPHALLARALEARGDVLRSVGQIRESRADFEAMLKLAEAHHDRRLRAGALSGLGHAALVRARWEEARGLLDSALALFVELGDRRSQGRVLAMLAAIRFNQDDPSSARALLVQALPLVRETRARAFEAICMTRLGIMSLALGSLSEARTQLGEALALHREAAARRWEGVSLSYLGLVEQEAGRLEQAQELHEQALSLLSLIGVRRAEGLALAASAGACLLQGSIDRAKQRYRRALEIARVMSPDHEGLFLGNLAVVAALEGDAVGASALFDAAERALAGHHRPAFVRALQVHRGHEALALARTAPRVEQLERAREQLALAEAWADRSAEVRFARALLAQTLRQFDGDQTARALVVGVDGVWFRPARSKQAVKLHRRRALQRLVHTLAERHLHEPGAAVPMAVLIESGWPGERVLPEAGLERVCTAIATLQKLGLGRVLLQSDDGYLFDPRAEVVRSPARTPPSPAR